MIAGSVYLFAGSTAPQGFLLCDGSAVSRDTYATLYAVIGDTYGAGDGSTTFNLPDLTGRVVLGTSSTYTLASTGGEETHALTTSEMPSHAHTIPAHGHSHTIKATTPAFSHSITQPAYKYNKPNSTVGCSSSSTFSARKGTSSATASRTNLSIADHAAAACTMSGGITDCDAFNMEDTGSGTGHSNMQPYLSLSYIIATGD